MTKHIAQGLIGLIIATASWAEPTDPGTYSATGEKPGVPAPPGYYVNTTGATAPTPAPVGTYIDTAGKSYATQASAGTYAPTTGMANALPAPVGHFVSSFGASAATPAPAGSYVSTTGATTAMLASQGTYVPCPAASEATQASPGHYVNTIGATEQTPAAPGYYIWQVGSSSAIAAPMGHYVPTAGATAANQAPPGTFVNITAASAATPAPAGYFVSSSGQSSAQKAPAGYYTPSAGMSAAIPAPAGSFVSSQGASSVTLAPPGYFVNTSGSTSAIAAPPGRYVPTAGATATLQCPPGTTSYVASAACRIIQADLPCTPDTAGPCYQTDAPEQIVATNQTGTFIFHFEVENASQEVGTASPLSQLTIVSTDLDGDDAGHFLLGFNTPLILNEGDSETLKIKASAPTNQSINVWLNLTTDQNASVGEPGQTQRIHLVLLQNTTSGDADGDGLLDTDEALLGTRVDLADTDGDGYKDGFEAANPQMNPLMDDSDLVDFFQAERAMFNLYTATDVQEGSMDDLVLEPLGGGQYQLEWFLMSTTNLEEGIWNTVSTNQLIFTPDGALDTQLFRIRAEP